MEKESKPAFDFDAFKKQAAARLKKAVRYGCIGIWISGAKIREFGIGEAGGKAEDKAEAEAEAKAEAEVEAKASQDARVSVGGLLCFDVGSRRGQVNLGAKIGCVSGRAGGVHQNIPGGGTFEKSDKGQHAKVMLILQSLGKGHNIEKYYRKRHQTISMSRVPFMIYPCEIIQVEQ